MRGPLKHPKKRTIKERKSMMIYTEGETEYGYFSSFKVSCKVIGQGSALNTVKEAILNRKSSKKTFDEYLIVFDKDDNSEKDFINANALAKKHGFKVAYSCEAFEIWWLFHFVEIKNYIPRKEYSKRLRKYIHRYSSKEKGVNQGEEIWRELYPHMSNAIRIAKSRHTMYPNPKTAYHQSVTTVFQLVEQLQARKLSG